MISFLTTGKPFRGDTRVRQLNCLRGLLAAVPGCEVIFFDAVEGAGEICRELGLVGPVPVATTPQGTPIVGEMFEHARRHAAHRVCCFINCDILLLPGLPDIVRQAEAEWGESYLLVGQRIDLDWNEEIDFTGDWARALEAAAAANGVRHPPFGSDYFVFPRSQYGRENVPPLRVGRGGWDNWMIYEARRRGRPVVDLSPDYRVIHQNHDYSHRQTRFQGYRSDPEASYNRDFLPRRKGMARRYWLDKADWRLEGGRFSPKPLEPEVELEEAASTGPATEAGSEAGEVAVAIFVHADPKKTAATLEALRRARPGRIYWIAEAARNRPGEAEAVDRVEQLTRGVDWPCELRWNRARSYLGADRRFKSGMDWLMAKEERAIVLQDGVEPDPRFFGFCREMLDRYAECREVFAVSGSNPLPRRGTGGPGHLFTRHQFLAGWATWRRAWEGFDLGMENWPEIRAADTFASAVPGGERGLHFWIRLFDRAYEGDFDAWEHAWTLHCWMRGGLAVLPAGNFLNHVGVTLVAAPQGPARALAGGWPPPPATWGGTLPAPETMGTDPKADAAIQTRYFEAADLRPVRMRREPEIPPKLAPSMESLLAKESTKAALASGEWEVASNALEEVRDIAQDDSEWAMLKGRLLLAQKRFGQAATFLRETLAKRPEWSPILTPDLAWAERRLGVPGETLPFPAALAREPGLRPLRAWPRALGGSCRLSVGEIRFVDAQEMMAEYDEHFCRRRWLFTPDAGAPRVIVAGAGIGLSILALARALRTARITAIEPDPRMFACLQQNLRGVGSTGPEVIHAVVRSGAGEAWYGGEFAGRSTGLPEACRGFGRHVPAVALADLLGEGPVELLALHGQGAELDTLSACRKQLAQVARLSLLCPLYFDRDQLFDGLLPFLRQEGFRYLIEGAEQVERPWKSAGVVPAAPAILRLWAWRNKWLESEAQTG